MKQLSPWKTRRRSRDLNEQRQSKEEEDKLRSRLSKQERVPVSVRT